MARKAVSKEKEPEQEIEAEATSVVDQIPAIQPQEVPPWEDKPAEEKKVEQNIQTVLAPTPQVMIPSVVIPPPQPIIQEQPKAQYRDAQVIVWPNGLCRDIISVGRFRVQSYLKKPEVLLSSKGNTFRVVSHCTLRIMYESREYGQTGNLNALSFKINLRNHKQVLRFFQNIYSWFTDDAYRNLFFVDQETGQLMVNMEMRQIKLHIGGDSRYDQSAMEAVPAVYYRDNEMREGCALTINNTANSDVIRDVDVESILGILETFSFQAETLLLTQIYQRPELWITEQDRFGLGRPPKVAW